MYQGRYCRAHVVSSGVLVRRAIFAFAGFQKYNQVLLPDLNDSCRVALQIVSLHSYPSHCQPLKHAKHSRTVARDKSHVCRGTATV